MSALGVQPCRKCFWNGGGVLRDMGDHHDQVEVARACLALAAVGFAFQRIADRAAAHRGACDYHGLTCDRLDGERRDDIDEALGLAEGPL